MTTPNLGQLDSLTCLLDHSLANGHKLSHMAGDEVTALGGVITATAVVTLPKAKAPRCHMEGTSLQPTFACSADADQASAEVRMAVAFQPRWRVRCGFVPSKIGI